MESGQEFHDVVDGRFAVGQIFQDVGDVATRLYDPLGVQIFALLGFTEPPVNKHSIHHKLQGVTTIFIPGWFRSFFPT